MADLTRTQRKLGTYKRTTLALLIIACVAALGTRPAVAFDVSAYYPNPTAARAGLGWLSNDSDHVARLAVHTLWGWDDAAGTGVFYQQRSTLPSAEQAPCVPGLAPSAAGTGSDWYRVTPRGYQYLGWIYYAPDCAANIGTVENLSDPQSYVWDLAGTTEHFVHQIGGTVQLDPQGAVVSTIPWEAWYTITPVSSADGARLTVTVRSCTVWWADCQSAGGYAFTLGTLANGDRGIVSTVTWDAAGAVQAVSLGAGFVEPRGFRIKP
jgi:hypothetical protein